MRIRMPGISGPLLTVILVAELSSCHDATGPRLNLPPLVFDVTIGCAPIPAAPYTCASPQPSWKPGDTMVIGEFVIDTTLLNTTAHITVRAICWANIAITRPGGAIDYLPVTSTCPDSTVARGDNAPRVYNLRAFSFTVPDAWTPGTYTATSLMLVNPPATFSRTFVVR